ncbi:vomeronasal type-1 receptor A11-like, partial [Meriones unguiculatus]|uniref:vomeronasal type-1 receptor A11-like n=1 Tax=Meriones unguiculatus TaxID=10047 RepID=UPI00293EECEF
SDIRNTFFSEIGIGISANSFLLLFYILKFIPGHRPRPTDVLIGLLALIHLLMLMFIAFIATDIFISLRGWDDTICKLIVYLYSIFRGLSLCTTSLLSVLQAIILSPRSSCLAKFKHKSAHYISCAFLFLSVLYVLISSHLLVSIIATPNLTSNNFMYVTRSCSLLPMSYLMKSTFCTLMAVREVFLISVMVISTWYMVALLCRHRKQAQHLHSTRLSPKACPEQRANRAFLLLMSFFVLMSILDGFISCSRTMFLNDPTSYYIRLFVVHSYATVSPFVFMNTEKHVVNFFRSMYGRMVNIILLGYRPSRGFQHLVLKPGTKPPGKQGGSHCRCCQGEPSFAGRIQNCNIELAEALIAFPVVIAAIALFLLVLCKLEGGLRRKEINQRSGPFGG